MKIYGQYLILIEDDEGTFLHDTLPIPHFTLASPEPLGLVDLLNIGIGLAFLQENMGLLGFGVGLDLVGDNQRELSDVIDAVTFSHDKGRNTGGGDSRGDGVALLGYVDLAMPASISLGGSEHVTSAAHVTESTLAGSVGTTSADTGNTCDGTTGTPGFGTGLVTC